MTNAEHVLDAEAVATPSLRPAVKRRGRRVSATQLGFHPVTCALLLAQIGAGIAIGIACRAAGFTATGGLQGLVGHYGPAALLLLFWMIHYTQPDSRKREWWTAEAALGFGLVLLGTAILAPAQYLAASFNRPLIDGWLAAADRVMGLHVPTLAAWTKAHPHIGDLLSFAYRTLAPQAGFVIGLIWWKRDRLALWEYVVTFHLCAFITIAASALWPAAGAFTYYGFTSTLDQSRFIDHFQALRQGTMTFIPFGDIEGLISMPSFHVIGGLLLTWAVRRTSFLLPMALLNTLLIISTVMTGAHYAVDVLGGFLTWGTAVLAYRCLWARHVPALDLEDQSAASERNARVVPIG